MSNDLLFPVAYDHEIASRCVYGADFVQEILGVELGVKDVYRRKREYLLSSRKIEGLMKIAEERQFYQENPVRFIQDFFNIQLLDSQVYLLQMAWTTPYVLILASRAYGKSFWISLFAMAKQMLSSEPWRCYIASGTLEQSNNTFKKIEDIANDRISSLIGSTGKLFKDEVNVPTNSDGFSHNPTGYSYTLMNDSYTKTLSSNVDNKRGFRSECVIFDECGFLPLEMINTYKPFAAMEKSFATGFDSNGKKIDFVRLMAREKTIPNQLVFVSSASSKDTVFYSMYRDYSKQMIAGNKEYFVAHVDCELVMKPTIMNVPTAPALKRSTIEADLRTNPEKARREYYCEFTSDAGADAIIRRGVITRNEETRKPILCNDTGNRKIVITYDPARSRDNSTILVSEIYDHPLQDKKSEKRMRLLNSVNLLDIGKKRKSPMQTPEQIEYLKELILDYNIGGDENYSNIIAILIDAGSGGGGVNIADYLMDDWMGKDGNMHKGLIDKEYSSEYVRKYPNAVNKIRLISPQKLKSDIYEAMIEMTHQDKISFTATYDNKGYLTLYEQVGTDDVRQEIVKLDWAEECALSNIDALKEEVVNMVRIKRASGKDSFELCPEKANHLHKQHCVKCGIIHNPHK